MPHLGLNSDVQAGGHRFHVQTSFSASNARIISHIFDHGRIVAQREVPVNGDAGDQHLARKLHAVHQDMVAEMELLFHIADKVREVKHPLSCLKLGQLFLQKNLLDDAIATLELALTLDVDSPNAYNYLGMAYLRRGEFGKSEKVLREGLGRAPRYADGYCNLGVAYLEQEKFAEALQAFDTALQINPRFFHALLLRALASLTMLASPAVRSTLPELPAHLEQVREQLERVLQATPAGRDNSRLLKCQEHFSRNEFGRAAAELQAMRQEMQAEAFSHYENEFYLKFMYGGKGRDDAFVQRYTDKLREAIQDYPEYADLHNHLGIAYLIQCRNLFLRALDEFRTALRINPNFKRAEKNLKLTENDGKGFLILLRALFK